MPPAGDLWLGADLCATHSCDSGAYEAPVDARPFELADGGPITVKTLYGCACVRNLTNARVI
jgi:hypothetical protein